MAVGSGKSLKATLKEHPILYAVLMCFVFETGMNAIFGYRQAGGGWSPASFLYGAIFIALAFLGAWACVELFKVRGQTPGAWARRVAYGLPFLGCLAVSQFSGWGVLGVTLADGGAKRDVAVVERETVGETLAKLKAERAGLDLPKGETKDGLEGKLKLEKTRTSAVYKDGDGPRATELKDKIALFVRAEKLDRDIEKAMGELKTAPAVAGGNPEFAVITDWTGASSTQVRKAWSVFLVALIGAFANFGFALVLASDGAAAASAAKPADPFLARFDLGPKLLPGGGGQALYDELVARFGREVVDPYLPGLAPRRFDGASVAHSQPHSFGGASVAHSQPHRTPPAPQEIPPVPAPPLSGGYPPPFPPSLDRERANASEQHVHGAPIQIHNHFSGAHPTAVGSDAAPQIPPPQRERERASSAPAAGAIAHNAPPLQPLLTGPPVDRTTQRNRLDHLLLFKQACLVSQPGAIVSADDMYARYAAWAGEKRLSQPAFEVLLHELVEVPTSVIAGYLHFADVAVLTQRPRAVSA